MEQWEDRWEHLQLILEVYQFARDAAVAEAWLMAHEPYLLSQDFGETLAAVETLLKKHEAFERSVATQEERFSALERLTTLELRQRRKRQEEEYEQQHPGSTRKKQSYAERYVEDFLPPPEPEPEPEPEPVAAVVREVSQEDVRAGGDAVDVSGSQEKSEEVVAEEASGAPVPPPSEVSDGIEGMLTRKHEWESTTKKASNRSWEKVYVVLSDNALSFFKDQKYSKAEPKTYHRHEPPTDLDGSSAVAATDYSKRPNVFRLKLANGGEYLFQCRDEEEMNTWITKVNSVTGAESSSSAGKAQTMPASAEGRRDEPKKRSFFTLAKKK